MFFQKIITSMSTKSWTFTSLSQSAVLISDTEMSPRSALVVSEELFRRFQQNFCCHNDVLYRLSSPARLGPAAQHAPLNHQPHVPDIYIVLFLNFYFYFFFNEPTVKRARQHWCSSVRQPRIFKLFIFWSVAFTELCSNSCRVIYYKNVFCESCCFQIVLFCLLFLVSHLRPSCPPPEALRVANQRMAVRTLCLPVWTDHKGS